MRKIAGDYLLLGMAISLAICTAAYFLPYTHYSQLAIFAFASLVIFIGLAKIILFNFRPLFWISYLPALFVGAWIIKQSPEMGPVLFLAAAWGFAGRIAIFALLKKFEVRNKLFAQDLRSLLPEKTILFLDNDNETQTDRASIQPGHLIRVQQDEIIPADGVVVFGSSLVDESSLTGDTEPRAKGTGSFVFAGTNNKSSSFIFRVMGAEKDTALMNLCNFLDKGISRKLSFAFPLLMVDLLIFLGMAIKIYGGDLSALDLFSFFMLAQAAPLGACLLTADHTFTARASALGTWWRDNSAVIKAALAGTICAESSGVLITRKMKVSSICGSKMISEDGILRLMAPLARRLDNEAAQAVLQEIRSRNIPLEIMDTYLECPGGISGMMLADEYRWIDELEANKGGINLTSFTDYLDERANLGESSILLLCNREVIGVVSFSQSVLNECALGLQWLQGAGIPFLLISSRSKKAVAYLANKLSIPHKFSETGSQEILSILRKLGEENLKPLWLCTENLLGSHPNAVKMGAGILTPSVWETLHIWSLRQDILSVARALKLARRARFTYLSLFFFFLCSESILMAFSLRLPLMSLVFFSLIPGFVGFLIAKNLDQAYLEIH